MMPVMDRNMNVTSGAARKFRKVLGLWFIFSQQTGFININTIWSRRRVVARPCGVGVNGGCWVIVCRGVVQFEGDY